MRKIKRFFMLEKNVFFVCYIIVIYMIITLDNIAFMKNEKYVPINVILMYIVSILVAFIVALIDYHRRKEIIDGICFQVIEKYKIKDQYERFLAIKFCIETYETKEKQHNVEMNVNVIEASIERDQAYSVAYPLMITITTALFIDKEIIPVTSPLSMVLLTLLALAVIELVMIIPRNAFIKKVVESIKREKNLLN